MRNDISAICAPVLFSQALFADSRKLSAQVKQSSFIWQSRHFPRRLVILTGAHSLANQGSTLHPARETASIGEHDQKM